MFFIIAHTVKEFFQRKFIATIGLVVSSVLFISIQTKAQPVEIPYQKFTKRPKLVVTIVIDQFRADYLTRFEKQFLKAGHGKGGSLAGFNELIERGAYFPFSEYEVLQNMTCPGHAMILTGSYPVKTGISLNEYFDQATQKQKYCVEDPKDGISPRALQTSTVGDELKNVSPKSKVFTMALKDRSAVALGGHRADMALWIDSKKGAWQTSSYYGSELPSWVMEENSKIQKDIQSGQIPKMSGKEWMTWTGGVDLAFSLLKKAIVSEKLGKRGVSDVVAMSISTHDALGHKYGPNSEEMEKITLHEDQQLSLFLNELNKLFPKLEDVVVVLTADHGVAPEAGYLSDKKIPSGRIDQLAAIKNINKKLDQAFGSMKEPWVVAVQSFNYYLNKTKIIERGLKTSEVAKVVKSSLLEETGIADVIIGSEELNLFHSEFRNAFIPTQNGDVIIVPKPFYYETGDSRATHMTDYNYDKMVPIVFYGGAIKKSVFINSAKVVDIAPTLSFMLGTLPPATSQGKVLPVYNNSTK